MSSIIFMFASDRAHLRVLDECPRRELSIGPHTYSELQFPEPFLGFFDWLRTTSGELIGFRLWVGKGREALVRLVPEREYIVRYAEGAFAVMFSDVRSVDEQASAEQNFGESRAFVGPDQSLVLVVTAEDLDDDDVSLLRERG